jgi:geranylgeranyl diphosphate synthase type II
MLSFINENKQKLDKYIDVILENKNIEPILREAMTYSLKDGKAIRGTLLIETIKALNIELLDESAYQSALAVEMVHAYSLIHDDLPAIDNDDYRRGKLTLHKKYGEDIAIVSGDALGAF